MASTDLAHFRRFIFESSFLDTYEIDPAVVEKIREDDVALMHFSFDYLANSIFGTQTFKINEEIVKEKVKEIKARQDDAVINAVEEYEELKKELNVKE